MVPSMDLSSLSASILFSILARILSSLLTGKLVRPLSLSAFTIESESSPTLRLRFAAFRSRETPSCEKREWPTTTASQSPEATLAQKALAASADFVSWAVM